MMDQLSREKMLSRIDEVMRTDATVSSEADFMMTHMPFKRLVHYKQGYEIGGLARGNGSYIINEDDYKDVPTFDEEVVLQNLVSGTNIHKFFMILGKNGSGKSHLIRWLYYQYRKMNEENLITNEETIFIQRAHNNLKDALRTVLAAGILPKDRIAYYEQKIGGGSGSASEGELKALLFANLKILVEYHKAESGLSEADKGKFLDFLNDEVIREEYFCCNNGPIDKLYNSLTTNDKSMADGDPFVDADFIKPTAEIRKMLFTPTHKAKAVVGKVANDLAVNARFRQKVIKYLNSLVGKVIERTSSINGADVKGIFEEIRHELKINNKNLTLFIEDINVYKGIDSALIEVLIQEHTEDNGLCRLKSVVGSTDYFFDNFNDSLKDRMTSKIVILEKNLLEDKSKLVAFAARYINAIHFSKEEVKAWYSSNDERPTWTSEYKFANVIVDDQEMSIFPFNENAIGNLFDCLFDTYKSPRGFLKYIIKEVEIGWCNHETEIVDSKHYFTANEGIGTINGFLTDDDAMAFRAQRYSDEEKREIVYTIWGNRTYKPDQAGNMAGVSDEILSLFEIEKDAVVPQTEPDVIEQPESFVKPGGEPQQPPVPKTDTKRANKIKKIHDWGEGIEKSFDYHKEARECLGKFILRSINWEMEDIPYQIAADFLSRLQNISIEGQTVDSTGVIVVKRSKDAADMLVAIISQKDEKTTTWNFKNGPEQQIFAKSWLLSNKDEIVANMKKALFAEKDVELLAVQARLCELLVNGLVKEWSDKELLEKVVGDRISNDSQAFSKPGKKWEGLQKKTVKNSTVINELFDLYFLNTVGSTKANAKDVKYFMTDPVRLISKIHDAQAALNSGKRLGVVANADGRIKILSEVIDDFMELIDECVNEEVAFAFKQKNSFAEWLGATTSQVSIRNTIEGMKEYLGFIKNEIGLNYPTDLLVDLRRDAVEKEIKEFLTILDRLTKETDFIQKILLAGVMDDKQIQIISREFQKFEEFMKERDNLFRTKVDKSINASIKKVKAEIVEVVDALQERSV